MSVALQTRKKFRDRETGGYALSDEILQRSQAQRRKLHDVGFPDEGSS